MKHYQGVYPVAKMASRLGVSVRSYYDYLSGRYRLRALRRQEHAGRIRRCFESVNGVYGAARISSELSAQGTRLSRTTVTKYMHRMGLKSRLRRHYRVKTTDSNHNNKVAKNLLERDFRADAPARKWVSDITYIRTRTGRFEYFTTVIDLFDRKVIGWSFSSNLETAHTVLPALQMALHRRKPSAKGLIFHSDRGVQYTSDEFVKLLNRNHLTRSNSRKGNCWDNAVAESFFKTLKAELVYGATLREPEKLRQQIFEWVEGWYNKRRRHSALGNKTIDEFWTDYNNKVFISILPNLLCG